MKKYHNLIIILSIVCVFSFVAACFVACNQNDGKNSLNGTYYMYRGNTKVPSRYYVLKDGKWNDESEQSGRYEVNGNNIMMYVVFFGHEEEYLDGTVSKGVLALREFNVVTYFCKDGATPPASGNQGGSGTGTGTTPSANNKTVTFDVNGGDREIEPMQYEVGKLMTGLPTPVRSGYNFVVWKDLNGRTYTSASVMPDENLTLYAYWEKIVSKYEDEYVSLKPASEGYKSDVAQEFVGGKADKAVYVEITSDDLGGVDKVGKDNNFTLRTMESMVYSIKSGYKWNWFYDVDFNILNGAQKFTLEYGSNLQFLAIENSDGVVVQTYVLDIYVKRDFYVALYDNLQAQEPYDTVRVIENERFPADTPVKQGVFEFDSRVYYNGNTRTYEPWDYATAMRGNLKLYQSYKPYTAQPNLNNGSLSENFTVTPYEQHLTLPIPQRNGYDFIGWQTSDGKYLTDLNGHATTHYLSEKNYNDISAVWQPKQYYYTVQVGIDQDVHTVQAMVPVVTYTDSSFETILEVLHVPQGTTCPAPTKVYNDNNRFFTDWYTMNYEFNVGSKFYFDSKIKVPTALYAYTDATNARNIIPLNSSKTFESDTALKYYYGFMPTAGTYTLKVTTTGELSFTMDAYDANPAKKYKITSSQTITLTHGLYEGCGFGFTVTEQKGSFTVEFSGATAYESNPVVQTNDNVLVGGDDVTLTAKNKEYYKFVGWYLGNKKVSDDVQFSVRSADDKLSYTAKYIYFPITFETNIEDAGIIRITEYDETSKQVTVTVQTSPGYTFVGWYNGVQKLSELPTYSVTISEDVEIYTAHFVETVTKTAVNNPQAGSVTILDGAYTLGQEIVITATTNPGYIFVSWYKGDELISSDLQCTIKLTADDVTYIAKWSKVTLTVNNGNAGSVQQLTDKYKVGDEVQIAAMTNPGYTFVGWFNGGGQVSTDLQCEITMTDEDVTYTATWKAIEYDITFIYDSRIGDFTEEKPTKYTIEETVGLPELYNTDKTHYAKWQAADGTIYTDSIPQGTTGDLELTAIWSGKHTWGADGKCTVCKVDCPYNITDDKIIFGSYPQRKVEDTALQSMLNAEIGNRKPTGSNANGWIDYGYYINGKVQSYMWHIDVEYKDAKYRGVYFASYRPRSTSSDSSISSSYQVQNGYKIKTVYWFQWEPITWRILSQEDGEALIMADIILDSQQYYHEISGTRTVNEKTVYSNNYRESDLRKWLNDIFYNTAFSQSIRPFINTTEVDNSANTTMSNGNKYACENTFDNVFLLSYRDVTNKGYGFSGSGNIDDIARQLQPSAYAQCQGAYVITSGSHKNIGWWWLRSPNYSQNYNVNYVSNDGYIYSYYSVDDTSHGVVPALYIQI